MGAYTVNLDKCIKKFTSMGQIEDSVVATIVPTLEEKYPTHQEFGFRVRRKDGSFSFVVGKWYMLNALNRNRFRLEEEFAKYIKKGIKATGVIALTPYIKKVANKIKESALILAPVDTGELRSSIEVEIVTK